MYFSVGQRAQALEHELARGRELEEALRNALARERDVRGDAEQANRDQVHAGRRPCDDDARISPIARRNRGVRHRARHPAGLPSRTCSIGSGRKPSVRRVRMAAWGSGSQ
jgi:hypothetical protein